MKKTTPRTTRFAPATRLGAAIGGLKGEIIDLGNPAPPPSDIGAQIVDFG